MKGLQLLRDTRFWRVFIQAGAVLLILAIVLALWNNVSQNLLRLGITLGFDFLNSQASFPVGETVIPYQASDPYVRAFFVGLLNTLRVSLAGIVLATIAGVSIGIARLSDNWLLRQLARVYVELLRNMPLLLQLFFWYFAVFLGLPPVETPIQFMWLSFSKAGILLPGGMLLSPEFSTLLLGLSFYTATFIAEIVRGGIQSVPKGQWEAARALGLNSLLMMRLVIFPQALRVIIPPITSQYLNLTKNSTLAVAIGYPDLYAVASTTFNQTGRSIEVMLILMGVYLTISLGVSLLTNWYNRSVQIVER
ncbi:MAG: ABC transporter permease subunit [Leptolyngbyaceae cyanobacterium bins.59]|nr:ABC transporter permease subunit [Leptolyngbyaceae cyanobacterium bins.59]